MLCNKTSIVPCNIYGGTQLNSQKYAACNAHIICATTGRFKVSFLITSKFIFILCSKIFIKAMMEKGDIDLKSVKYLVLDEADRMLDDGFGPDIEAIVENMNKERA